MPTKWIHRYERKPGRWVFEPSESARVEGAEVKAAIEKYWQPPSYYFHLNAGGHIAALGQHQHSSSFIKVDIADFFGSVSRSRLSRILKTRFGHREALRLATASTVRHPSDSGRAILPYGFIQSPLLASLALSASGLGALLDSLQKENGLTVTVYVDDIIISGHNQARLHQVLKEVKARAELSHFKLSDEKEQGPASSITAFNIELAAGENLALSATRLTELSDVVASSVNARQIAGVLAYVRAVNADQAATLLPGTSLP